MRCAKLVVTILILGVVTPGAWANWLTGSDSRIKEAALPVNRLRLTPRDRVTLEPLIYHVQGPDGGIVSVFPEENMTVPLEGRPLLATTRAVLMTGDAKIVKIKACAEGRPIKVIVPSQNGWEDECAWLKGAIPQAQECMLPLLPGQKLTHLEHGRLVRALVRAQSDKLGPDDPGPFPPFISLPSESAPRVGNDGFIYFGRPQASLPIIIVSPVSNLLPGDAHSVTLGVFVDRNRLWEETAATFMLAHPHALPVPIAGLEEHRSEVVGAGRPMLEENKLTDITTRSSASASATATTSTTVSSQASTAPSTAVDTCPDIVRSYVYGELRKPASQIWSKPCVFHNGFTSWRQHGERTTYFCTFVVLPGEKLLTDRRGARITLNGQSYARPERPSDLIDLCQKGREGIVFGFSPPHCKVVVAFPLGEREVKVEFETGDEGSVTYAPVVLKEE